MSFGLLLITGQQTHQENYARALADDPRCQLIGLTDAANLPPRREQLNRALAEELQIPYLADLTAALSRSDVDAVCVCAEPERRGELARQCVAAGKHVYLDKETDITVAGARDLARRVAEAGVCSQTFSLVRSPLGTRARALVQRGSVGELKSLHAEMFFAKGFAGTADLSRPRQEKPQATRFTFFDSKRELLCVGWYPLVLFQWLTGQRVVRVRATTSNYFFAEHQRNDVEDFATLLLQYDGGLQATVTAGRTGWSSHPAGGLQALTLTGTRDYRRLDGFEPRLESYCQNASWSPPAAPHPEDPMGFWSSTQVAGGIQPKTAWQPIAGAIPSDAAHFWDCVEQGCDSDVNAALGADVLAVILAAYRSAATGAWVTVD